MRKPLHRPARAIEELTNKEIYYTESKVKSLCRNYNLSTSEELEQRISNLNRYGRELLTDRIHDMKEEIQNELEELDAKFYAASDDPNSTEAKKTRRYNKLMKQIKLQKKFIEFYNIYLRS